MSERKEYDYVGGGYFRERGIPKGETADILHGDHAVEPWKIRLAIATKALEEIADKDNIGISLGAVARRALEQIKGTG